METNVRKSRSVRWAAWLGVMMVAAGILFLRFELTIRAQGTVRAREEARLFAPADGRITHIAVTSGVAVSAGQVIATLDSTEWQLRLAGLQREIADIDAQLVATDLRLREAEIRPMAADVMTAGARSDRLQRIRELQSEISAAFETGHDDRTISRLDMNKQRIETLKTELDLLEAELLAQWQKSGLADIEKAKLEAERKRLADQRSGALAECALLSNLVARLTITAPFSGQVVSMPFRFEGQTVKQGEEILRVALPDNRYRIRALVGERNVDRIRPGCRAVLESGVYNSLVLSAITGTVFRVSPDVESESAPTPQYEVLVDVDQPSSSLVLGSTMDVRILLGKRSIGSLFGGHTSRL